MVPCDSHDWATRRPRARQFHEESRGRANEKIMEAIKRGADADRAARQKIGSIHFATAIRRMVHAPTPVIQYRQEQHQQPAAHPHHHARQDQPHTETKTSAHLFHLIGHNTGAAYFRGARMRQFSPLARIAHGKAEFRKLFARSRRPGYLSNQPLTQRIQHCP